jgi:hypothetical protein
LLLALTPWRWPSQSDPGVRPGDYGALNLNMQMQDCTSIN